MYCRKCGKEINDEAVVCPHCGVLTTNGASAFYGQPVPPAQPLRNYDAPAQLPGQLPAQTKGVNGLGIAGFVVGLVSLFAGVYFCIPAVVGLILSIFAVMNRKKYKSCGGLAIAGLVISAVALAFWFIVWFYIIMGLIIFY